MESSSSTGGRSAPPSSPESEADPGPGAARLWLKVTWDRIAAADPALSRLRLALRILIALLLSAGVLGGVTFFVHPLSPLSYSIALMAATTGALAVRDAGARRRALTRFFAAAASLLSVAIVSLVHELPIARDVLFILVVFVAVYIRAFGKRWHAVGMFAFMAYFLSTFLHPELVQLPWIALAVFVAITAVHLSENYLLPDHPRRDFRRGLATIDHRVDLLLREIRAAAVAGGWTRSGRKVAQAHRASLHEAVLLTAGFIPDTVIGGREEHRVSKIAVHLLEYHLAAERLLQLSVAHLPPASLVEAARLHRGKVLERLAQRSSAGISNPQLAARQAVVRLHATRERLHDALVATQWPAPQPHGTRVAQAPAGNVQSQLIDPDAARAATQVSLAAALAMVGGNALSSAGWHWAVLASFLVFTNTQSRADTAVKAFERSVGAFAGLILGSGAAILLQGNLPASLVLIALCVFLAYYFIQVSLGMMIASITVVLALFYGLFGRFSPDLLALRLGETLVGAAAGVLVAFVVMPKRAIVTVTTSLDHYLTTLDSVLNSVASRVEGNSNPTPPLLAAGALDRAYADLAKAARPLGGPWSLVTRLGHVRQTLLILMACTYWSRALAHSVTRSQYYAAPDEEILCSINAVQQQLAQARNQNHLFLCKPARAEADPELFLRRTSSSQDTEDPLVALDVLSLLLRIVCATDGSLRR